MTRMSIVRVNRDLRQAAQAAGALWRTTSGPSATPGVGHPAHHHERAGPISGDELQGDGLGAGIPHPRSVTSRCREPRRRVRAARRYLVLLEWR
jgi:hypothetical protein